VTAIKARDLLPLTPTIILETYPKTIDLIYDDGITVTSSTRKAVYSWYFWEFHRRYPFLPLTHSHHADSIMNGQLLSSNTHIDLISRISKQLIMDHNLTSYQQKEEILGVIYYVTNQLHNELMKFAGRYVATLDILDILELAQAEQIVELRNKTEPTANSIADFYSNSHKVIFNDPKFQRNNLVQFIRMKILNINQVNQCVLARGFPIEVTGTIMSTPIMSNYTTGMYKLYDYVAESRAAAKHLYSAEAPLQDTEYFARRLQLSGMVVQSISPGDCGSTKYIEWLVKPPSYTETGRQIYAGDLKFMKGKMYLDETTNSLKEIIGKESHLYGKIISIRSSLHCQENNPHKVCSVCFGMLHHNVSRFANLGHLCAATLTQQLTQTILSTKHIIGSAVGTEILMKEDAQRYLTFMFNTMSFHLKPFNKTSQYKMIVNRNTAIGLTDLKLLRTIDQINPRRISALSQIVIQETLSNGAIVEIPIQIEQNKRYGYFSYEFLHFLKDKGWSTNEYDHFVFDLTGWNAKFPVIRVPDMEYSYADHADHIASIIESNTKNLHKRAQADAPVLILQELFDQVNTKIDVNLSLLEVLIYAVMTPGVEDYGMARHHPNAGLHVARFVITNRSLGAAYAYEDQFKTISNPRNFFQENRPSSPIDVFLTPKEVVENLHMHTNLGSHSKIV